ncbi:hypothetical protein [Desulfitobacterium sp. PCE1]|nr:hypothetical protein [Desulfitobacterium sp. PCE1]
MTDLVIYDPAMTEKRLAGILALEKMGYLLFRLLWLIDRQLCSS